ncbi:PREDICTED: uncharacterized protein LOC104600530 [Nelumbo nucifera]|nr:PREDICTED: uncharacterized protein LOC104600530 [Nelumbo nucifera]XP_010261825.1 PREDICTED: uncharacterized protein LOC104600530 [Nelumbo nucifera]
MSATVLSDSMAMTNPESQPTTIEIGGQSEVEFAKCDCCGLTEECTPAYIARIRERYQGRWICGLCAEAVKDEIVRSERLISTEEALNRHMNFCKKFRSSTPPSNPTEHLISAMRQLLRRSLDSPRALRSTPSSPLRKESEVRPPSLARSESCFPSLAG